MQKNQDILEHGSYGKLIINLCIPTIIVMLVTVLYNMADTFFIGQTGDPNKIAAISLCSPLFSILSGLGTLLGSGGCTSISLSLGKKDYDKVKSYSAVCFYGALLLGLLFLIIVLTGTSAISKFLGADSDTMDFAVSYLRIIAVGAPFVMVNNVFSNIIRSDGAVTQSMISNLIGTFTNIALDALFIMVFHWDVVGAAVATVLGNICSCIYIIYYVTKKQQAFSIRPKHIVLKADIVLPLFTLGLPMACSTLLMSISHILSNNLMVGYGNVALAAQGVAGKIGMLISMIAMGICMGFQPAVSYNYGRQNLTKMYQIIRNTAVFVTLTGLVLSLGCYLARDSIITAFIDNDEVISHAQIMVIASVATGPFYGIYQLCQTFLQSTGKASYATLASVLDKGIVYIPALYILNHFFGLYGIVFTGCVSLFFSLTAGIILSVRWNRTIKNPDSV